MALKLIVEPAAEPLSLEEAIAHLKPADGEDMATLSSLIAAARTMAEQELDRSLMQQTWKKTLDEFPDAIRLDNPPIQSVTSVKYVDINAVQQTLDPATYQVDLASEPGWIVPASGYAWPATLAQANVLEVVYVAGYADAKSVPEAIKNWMKIVMREMYDNPAGFQDGRQLLLMPHVERLLDRYRITRWV
jgi:uncharacterized phiE125 gp8 family phage protein